ncbi:phosphoenolpyruvate--protein phosphotransferase [Varunaivibrio sulfuroxidans]|uniref:Phosphoenolpyruvate-protein phosphotransferase n=1 Tax=Varunaivibrio sulfuroxidans TaxID=1773489 RepID=A0A4V2UND7_9PROT|nr:phosphoenolpyruvate--protein phosphotransferase [Varunaivibrio sulfuroxidans]TCS61651.1 phosphoenolpyruvate--protein phosphotransferase [Varunaivibrio sulfuroxidans]WES29478.1 phosphoenolpyruvate--protein phosphotransferase [Varunaivibrio sulfuroxidans]
MTGAKKNNPDAQAATKKPSTAERIIDALGVSPGIGIGRVHVRDGAGFSVPEYAIDPGAIEAECSRLEDAVVAARRQIAQLRTRSRELPTAAAEEMDILLDAYQQMLTDSRLVRGAFRRIREERFNAEAAVQHETQEIAESFAALKDRYIAARIDDIREVATRLIRNLNNTPDHPVTGVPKGSVIVTEEMTPADAAQLDPALVTGFAAMLGGAQGHTAIMARALGIPAVLGATQLLQGARTGDRVIIDGGRGRVIVNPSSRTLTRYEKMRADQRQALARLSRMKKLPSVTRDGVAITLHANVELPMEMATVARSGATGIGLLRTEFMFMNRKDIPDEDEQYRDLRDIVAAMNGGLVTIRTLDIGGEKAAAQLTDGFGDSTASALGLRGIRLSLAKPAILETQFAAILRAGAHGPVRILLPMVSTIDEVRHARDILARVVRRLKRKRVKIAPTPPPIGVMIEVPSAALSADALAQSADFFAIGSNDLTQYTLAIDRTDERVAHLYDPLHPAVLRLIQFSTEAAWRARKPVSICGEMAGDPRFCALLLGLGFRELSMAPGSIGLVKQRIRDIELAAAQRRAQVIMDQIDAGRIAMLLDDFNALA